MTAVLQSPSQLPSSPSSQLSCSSIDALQTLLTPERDEGCGGGVEEEEEEEERKRERVKKEEEEEISVLALLVTVIRRSLAQCRAQGRGEVEEEEEGEENLRGMEIGWPTNVRHVAHVTFDRFHGFLGLPVEFEPEVPGRAPSARSLLFYLSQISWAFYFWNGCSIR